MLHKISNLKGFKVIGKDDEIGRISDFYFDDHTWHIRYAVDKTGFLFTTKKVLISVSEFDKPDFENKFFRVDLSVEQIKNGPNIDAYKPVSRQDEKEMAKYYAWPTYWASGFPTGPFGSSVYNTLPVKRDIVQTEDEENRLRSFGEVIGYSILANDTEFGYAKDLLIDDDDWSIQYVVIETRRIMHDKYVIVRPEWLNFISFYQKNLKLPFKKEDIINAPTFDYSMPIRKDEIKKTHEYFKKLL